MAVTGFAVLERLVLTSAVSLMAAKQPHERVLQRDISPSPHRALMARITHKVLLNQHRSHLHSLTSMVTSMEHRQ